MPADLLAEILAHKRAEIERLDLPALKSQAADSPAPRDFLAAVTRDTRQPVRLIAELKRASPSRGLLAPEVDLLELARLYAANGAAALSVLTDEKFFLGSLEVLHALRFTECVPLPLLRKDFILAPAQLYETRAAGADAVLLVAAALPDQAELAGLHALALDLRLTPLVEVHKPAELERVLRLPRLALVGINNRDLRTFDVSLDVTARLRPHIPAGIPVVSESGIFTAAHVARAAALGVDAVLVGVALVTAPDVGAKVRELAGVAVAPSLPTGEGVRR
jgi:indole-3-glycerol phosphate synthase